MILHSVLLFIFIGALHLFVLFCIAFVLCFFLFMFFCARRMTDLSEIDTITVAPRIYWENLFCFCLKICIWKKNATESPCQQEQSSKYSRFNLDNIWLSNGEYIQTQAIELECLLYLCCVGNVECALCSAAWMVSDSMWPSGGNIIFYWCIASVRIKSNDSVRPTKRILNNLAKWTRSFSMLIQFIARNSSIM